MANMPRRGMCLVLAAALASAWGVGSLWEGPRLRSRTVGDVLRRANTLRQKGGDFAIVSGLAPGSCALTEIAG